MRNIYLIILTIVVVSACTGSQPRFENNGIKITHFSANPDDVSESREVDFELELENVGSTTANNVVAELINARNIWRGDTSPKDFGSMKPASLGQNAPGDAKIWIWTIKPPDLPEGIVAPLDIKARVTYDYSSTQAVIVKAINIAQEEILDARGESVSNPITIAQDDFSPLKVSVTKGPLPLIIDPDDTGDITYRLEITNVGDGWPITFNEVGKITGKIDINGPGISSSECSAGTGDFNSNGATLRSDGKASVICSLAIGRSEWQEGPREDSFLIKIELTYTYFIEKTASVTVRGKAGSSDGSTGTPVTSGCEDTPICSGAAFCLNGNWCMHSDPNCKFGDYCPAAGTVTNNACYYGTRSCNSAGTCSLSKCTMQSGQTCTASGCTVGGTNSACGSSYTVRSGDTLSSIALSCYGNANKFSCICTANGLSNCNVITVGQVLTLPRC